MKQDSVFRDAALVSDRAAVRDILERSGFFRADEVDVAVELIDEYLAKGEASGYYFSFADERENPGRPAGYVCYGPTPCTAGSFDLYWIAVDPERQGRGLGRVLAARAEDAAAKRGGRKMYVETSGKALYEPTREFYRSIGYAEAAWLTDFYDVGDDKVIFQKDL